MANKIQESFQHVRADDALKDSAKQYLSMQRYRGRKRFFGPAFGGALAAVCAMLILASGIGGYSWILKPVSYVSMDVNPSIELGLNRYDRVVSAVAYNDQGAELLEGLSLKWKRYTDAINIVAGSDLMQSYLQGEEELVLTVAADSSREQELAAGVKSCSGHIGHGSRSVQADISTVSEAHDNGLSVGKYQAYLALAQYDETVTVDDCKGMSMAEIHGKIIEHEHGHGHTGDLEADGLEKDDTVQQDNPALTEESTQDDSVWNTDEEPQGHHHHRNGHDSW